MGKKVKDVLYVYDRICTKTSKKNELISEYGKTDTAKVHKYTGELGKGFAKKQKDRARAYSDAHPYSDAARNSAKERRASSTAYTYAHTYEPTRQGGGERVRAETRPLKLVLDRIINLFDTLEERGQADEWIAKQRAIARKRFYDHKNTILTALFVTLFAVLFLTVVYKVVFVVKTVNVTGTEKYTDSEVLAASGIVEGDTLYSFSRTDAENEIIFRCPYIRSAEITRTIPNTVSVAVDEDTEMYFADIWGDYLILSPSLRVLGKTDRGQARENGLVELVLPAVSSSVTGKNISFVSARDERFIRNILSEVSSSELFASGMLDKVDLSDEYAVAAQAEGKYLLKFGNESDSDLKLKMAYKTIASLQDENTSPARVDLTVVGEASVRFDMKLELD